VKLLFGNAQSQSIFGTACWSACLNPPFASGFKVLVQHCTNMGMGSVFRDDVCERVRRRAFRPAPRASFMTLEIFQPAAATIAAVSSRLCFKP
jgi:hypothetical protein